MAVLDSPSTDLSTRRSIDGRGLIAIVVSIVVALDQFTKRWAVSRLDDGSVIHVVWTLQLNLAYNSGMAFGRGRGWGPIIGVVAMVVIVGLVLSIRRHGDIRSNLGVALVVAGALGNIIDRIFRGEGWLRGEVVDFIDFQWFPIFNVADIAVNVGGVILVWTYLRGTRTADRG